MHKQNSSSSVSSYTSEDYKSTVHRQNRPLVLNLAQRHEVGLNIISEQGATLEDTPLQKKESDPDVMTNSVSGNSGCSFSVASSFQQSLISQISRSYNMKVGKPRQVKA